MYSVFILAILTSYSLCGGWQPLILLKYLYCLVIIYTFTKFLEHSTIIIHESRQWNVMHNLVGIKIFKTQEKSF